MDSQDLHHRHQTEQEIAAEQRFRVVVEAAPNAMVMVNQAGEIVMVNAHAERIFGYSRSELLGQPVEMLVPERFRNCHPGLRATFFADLRPRPMGAGHDLYGIKNDGSEFPVEIGLNPIQTDEGTMVLSAIVDITERKRAELALRESEIRLQESHSELLHLSRLSEMGQTVAMVVHELNQPLTVIRSYMELVVDLLDRGGDLPPARLRNAVERAAEQAIRAGRIIEELRGFVSRGDGEKRIEAIPPLVKEAVELAVLGSKHRGISVSVQDGLGDVTVVVDKIQIQQVLLNLLRNAAEAVAGQERREIALVTEVRGDTVQISVIDYGPGLPEEVKTKLFQPFNSTKKTGMGVGLAICHTIITAHDGQLWAELNPEGGTIFRFTLPIAPAGEQIVTDGDAGNAARGGATRGRSRRRPKGG